MLPTVDVTNLTPDETPDSLLLLMGMVVVVVVVVVGLTCSIPQ